MGSAAYVCKVNILAEIELTRDAGKNHRSEAA